MIRKACLKDVSAIEDLLYQVHDVHANIRPDLFIKGAKKYTKEQIEELINKDENPIFVYDDNGVKGYAFCYIRETTAPSMVKHKGLFIDDLCVTKDSRGMGVGKALYEYVLSFAKELGCYNVTLNVWEGNDAAKKFYEHVGLKVQETKMEKIL